MLRKRRLLRTIQEVIERNTGMTAMEFLNPEPKTRRISII